MSVDSDRRSWDAAVKHSAPAHDVAIVNPSDTNNLPDGPCKGLLVTVTGNLVFTAEGGGSSGTVPVTAGQIIPIRISRVLNTGTTASVLALY